MPLLAALGVFAVLWFLIYRDVNRAYQGSPIALDPKDAGGKGTFEPHSKNYQEIAKLVIGLSSASIAAIAVLLKGGAKDLPLPSYIAWPLVWFAMAIVYGVLFVGMMSWRYEIYCHQPSSYTPKWYATILALGFSLLVMLAGGYAIFAWILLQP